MSQYQTAIYTRGDTLPTMDGGNFYHSPELFHIVERTPGQRPCMAVATDGQGRVVGHILVFLLRASWMPLLYWQAHAYGEGDYAEDVNSEEVFGLLLEALVRRLRRRLCFFIEFSDISRKMFGYKYFRAQGFFPIPWQEIHNSLHSMDPHDRLQPKMLKKIGHIYQQGVVTREVTTEEDLDRFVHLVRGFYRWKVHRVVPPEKQIAEIYRSDNGRLFATLYKGRLIGGCVCVYSEGNAYLWYLASLRKRYARLHPATMTVWQAIIWAWKHNYAHIYFLDAGLPYPNNPFREFILRFGGKPVAKYRWFRFSIGWLNKLLSWIWKE
jgi:hypothetical protein